MKKIVLGLMGFIAVCWQASATIISVSGPSCVGKTSICKALEKELLKKHTVKAFYWDKEVWSLACGTFFNKHKNYG